MTAITTHVLDAATGRPAGGLAVALHGEAGDAGNGWTLRARERTDEDGRIAVFPEIGAGRWRLVFETGTPFLAELAVTFVVAPGREHVHLPLLLSPFGATVYRGS